MINSYNIGKILRECLLNEIRDDSGIQSDIDAVNAFKMYIDDPNYFDYHIEKEGAFLLTNGEMVYVWSHQILENTYPMERLGAIRMSKDATAVSLSKYPTSTQLNCLNYNVAKFMKGRFNLEMIYVPFSSQIRGKLDTLINKVEELKFFIDDHLSLDDNQKNEYQTKAENLSENIISAYSGCYSVFPDMNIAKIIQTNFKSYEQVEELYDQLADDYAILKKEILTSCDKSDGQVVSITELVTNYLQSYQTEFHGSLMFDDNIVWVKNIRDYLSLSVEMNSDYIRRDNPIESICEMIYDTFEALICNLCKVNIKAFDHYDDLFFSSRNKPITIRMINNIIKDLI